MFVNRYPLTAQEFERLKSSGWEIRELPRSEWAHIPNLPRRDDLVAVFYSGCMNQEKVLNGISSVAGFDAVAFESRPKPGEPELNVYHGVIQKVDETKNAKPFILHAPSTEETLFGHWGGYEMLQKYLNTVAAQSPTISVALPATAGQPQPPT